MSTWGNSWAASWGTSWGRLRDLFQWMGRSRSIVVVPTDTRSMYVTRHPR